MPGTAGRIAISKQKPTRVLASAHVAFRRAEFGFPGGQSAGIFLVFFRETLVFHLALSPARYPCSALLNGRLNPFGCTRRSLVLIVVLRPSYRF
ncbi:unnamed protein product [Notodromas monacha]|uniref:Uncharacterized protein n=1 Tax=Notodromas monacha TaxID=399045 RepID=A0A7R9BZE9_9CRUS|nr:unnamed protein product [Notodromas monacha]CAG0924500.1 unnamed protein product [Notodromas monacha]